jgi:transcription initiation factor TFIIIB Brf1 subunit/transcription initiation factor TFIIB
LRAVGGGGRVQGDRDGRLLPGGGGGRRRRVRRAAWRLREAVELGGKPSIEDYVGTLATGINLPAPVVKSAVELLEKNRRLLFGKNPWVWAAALWLASFRGLGLLKALAEASGATTASIRKAGRMKV